MINYLLLMGLLTALLVAVYFALIRWLHTPVRTKTNEHARTTTWSKRLDVPQLPAVSRRRAGMVGRPSRSRLITAARLSSFNRTSRSPAGKS